MATKAIRFLGLGVALMAGGVVAMAGTICPAASGSNPFPHPPDPSATGCNVVITIASNGTVSTAVTDSTPYENSEDVLVGVKNNSASTVGSLALTSSTGAFGFDGDGICTFTFVGSTYCNSNQVSGVDPGDYQGPTSTFTAISGSGNNGTVNFSPAIAAGGGTAYFSLEGIVTASLGVTVGGGGGGGGTPTTPAPPAVFLLVTGLAALGMWRLGRRFAS